MPHERDAANAPPGPQFIRFALVGVAATLTHALALTVLVETLLVDATLANGLAFVVAVQVTYWGQRLWVFRRAPTDASGLVRFAVTAAIGLGLNVAIMALAVDGLQLDYRIGFAAALVAVPLVSFILSRKWVFADPQPPAQNRTGA